MIKDEYEILAYNDLFVAKAHLDTIYKVLMSLNASFDPNASDLEKAYLGLYEFADKYKYRMDDIRAVSGLIEKARSKHRKVLAERDQLKTELQENSRLLEETRSQYIDLMSQNEEMKKTISKLML